LPASPSVMGQEAIMEVTMVLIIMELITLNIMALPMQLIMPLTLNILAPCPRELLSGPSLIM